VCLSVHDHIFGTTRPIFINCLCMLPMAMTQSSSGGIVIRYVFRVVQMTSYLLISQGCSTLPSSTRSLGLGYKLCAIIPAAGQRTHGTTFRTLKVTSQVAAPGAESAVYDCLVYQKSIYNWNKIDSSLFGSSSVTVTKV